MMKPVKFKLFFKEKCLGSVELTGSDFPWNHGIFFPLPEAEEFREFFLHFIGGEEMRSGFSQELTNSSNWYLICLDDGTREDIQIPWIYEDNKIGWGWR